MPKITPVSDVDAPIVVEPIEEEPKPAKAKKPAKANKPAKAAKAKAKPTKKPAEAKRGPTSGVRRVVAALACLRTASTAEAIAEIMGVGRPGAVRSLGSAGSTDPATAIGAGLVKTVVAGGPDAEKGERMFRYELTAAGKKLAEQAAKTAGSAKKAAARPMSQVGAAIEVLKAAKEPMSPTEIMEIVEKKGLWTSTRGATPIATLSAVMGRDVAGEKPKFKKVSRGHFTLTALGAKS